MPKQHQNNYSNRNNVNETYTKTIECHYDSTQWVDISNTGKRVNLMAVGTVKIVLFPNDLVLYRVETQTGKTTGYYRFNGTEYDELGEREIMDIMFWSEHEKGIIEKD